MIIFKLLPNRTVGNYTYMQLKVTRAVNHMLLSCREHDFKYKFGQFEGFILASKKLREEMRNFRNSAYKQKFWKIYSIM